ncbi:MAG: redoxin domain-containing protein [Candidatus Acidiferrum sp.]
MATDRLQFANRHSKISGGMPYASVRFGPLRRFSVVFGTVLALLLPFLAVAQKTAENLDGAPADPFSSTGAKGKPVVLLFLRTDCPISNRYAPLIQKMSVEYQGRVSFWLVYPNPKIDAEKIRQHERGYGYDLPALRDPHHALVAQAQVQVTPEAAVFDGNRHLLYHGRIDDLYQAFGRTRALATTHELDDAIQAALSGKKPPANAPAVGCYIADLE